MPSLPRIRSPRTPRNVVVAPAERRRLGELESGGLTWIHLDAPTQEEAEQLADRFGWHALDVEDVLSKRQRPNVDDYVEEGYLFVVIHFPVYDKSVGRLNAGELDVFLGPDYLVTLPNVQLDPVSRLFRRLFLEKLAAAHEAGRLHFFGAHAPLAERHAFAAYLASLEPFRRGDRYEVAAEVTFATARKPL